MSLSNPLFYLLGFSVFILFAWTFYITDVNTKQDENLVSHSQFAMQQAVRQHQVFLNFTEEYEKDMEQLEKNRIITNDNMEYYAHIIKKYHPESDIILQHECPVTCDMGCVFEDNVPYCLDVVIEGDDGAI